MKSEKFFCDKCGMCCMNLKKSEIYAELDRGDGVCRFFDEKSHLCSVYEQRPLECNVDEAYDKLFSKIMTREDYYKMNYDACKRLKNKQI